MVEIFRQLNTHSEIGKNVVKSQDEFIGCTISNVHRLIYFYENQEQPIYIDFFIHDIIPGNFYIIPAGHLLYLPLGTNSFVCINRSPSQISVMEKIWIYQQKYKFQKVLDLNISKIEISSLPQNNIISRINTHFSIIENTPSLQYLHHADNLCNLFSSTIFNHQLSVTNLVKRMNITVKTLQRICKAVFGQKPIEIIRYHFLLKIIFQILSCKKDSFSEIASSLGFRNASTFTRYVRTISGATPSEIRDNHLHIII